MVVEVAVVVEEEEDDMVVGEVAVGEAVGEAVVGMTGGEVVVVDMTVVVIATLQSEFMSMYWQNLGSTAGICLGFYSGQREFEKIQSVVYDHLLLLQSPTES